MSRIIFSILIIFSLNANASSILINPADTIPKLTKAEYKKLSRNQYTLAIVLVSVGGAAVIYSSTVITGTIIINETLAAPYDVEKETIPTGFFIAFVVGAILALCSISIFQRAGENRRMSNKATVGLNIEKLNGIPTASIGKTYFPSLRFTVRF